jgi:hypothetical protein
VLGDTPYSEHEAERLDRLIGDINAHELAFVVHLGDIGTARQACTDEWLDARRRQFGRIRQPFLLLPGDNEWTDCHAVGADPETRLAKWRSLFCFSSISGMEKQPGAYCEHVRWRAGDALFVALNVPGSNNNLRQPEEHKRRMRAVFQWLEEGERAAGAGTLVVMMQANPFVPREGFAELRERLRELGERRAGRVVLVHGDTHLYRDDMPYPGLRRLEVWGAPFVSWIRGGVLGGELHFDAPLHR